MAGKTDRRVKYTKAALKESLLMLMRDRPIEKITVTQICENADINRGTFYAHFSDPRDLLVQIENELFAEIAASIESSLNADDITQLLTEIFKSIEKNSALCRILFSDYGDKDFLARIIMIARERSIAEWKRLLPSAGDDQLELLYTFFANGCVALISRWLQNGMAESPDELVSFIKKISIHGLHALG